MSGHPAGEERRIDLAAAEWLIRQDRGLSAVEQDEFFQWLAADPRHGEWLARHQQSWTELDLLTEWRPGHSAEPNPDLLAPPRRVHGWMWPALLAAAAGVALMFAFWPQAEPVPPARPVHPAPRIAADYENRVLDDGSIVELNRGAAITVNFTPAERNVHLLRGEAHFKVAKNPLRPFVVHADKVEVRAVGTAFDVLLENNAVDVLVTEGRVKVSPPAPSTVPDVALQAGQRTVVPLALNVTPLQIAQVSPEQETRLLAWRPQLFDFNSTPLADVVAEFNRHNRVQMLIEDPALASTPIVASFRSDNIDGFVRLLEVTAGVQAVRTGAVIKLSRVHR